MQEPYSFWGERDLADLVDYEALHALKDFIGDAFDELVETYTRNADQYVQTIVDGLESEDAQKVVDSAHPLKSSAGNLGLMKLYELCKELEDMANEVLDGKLEFKAVQEHGTEIESIHKESSALLEAEL